MYKLRLLVTKFTWWLRSALRISAVSPTDFRISLIRKYAAGKTFADIGSMWGVSGLYSFVAEECGAERVVSVDLYRTAEFTDEMRRRGSTVKFVQGDILLSETVGRVGICDVVFCSGVLYHVPNPLALLLQLRMMCDEVLILCTALIPEVSGMRNMAVFYPVLDWRQRGLWGHCDKWLKVPYEPSAGYANNFWGLTPSCVGSMLELAGFEVVERHLGPFRGCFVCRTVSIKCVSPTADVEEFSYVSAEG